MITRERVVALMRSARLEPKDGEIDEIQLHLDGQIRHLELQMSHVRVGATDTIQTAIGRDALRADLSRPSLDRAQILTNSAPHVDGCIVVPRVVPEG